MSEHFSSEIFTGQLVPEPDLSICHETKIWPVFYMRTTLPVTLLLVVNLLKECVCGQKKYMVLVSLFPFFHLVPFTNYFHNFPGVTTAQLILTVFGLLIGQKHNHLFIIFF